MSDDQARVLRVHYVHVVHLRGLCASGDLGEARVTEEEQEKADKLIEWLIAYFAECEMYLMHGNGD